MLKIQTAQLKRIPFNLVAIVLLAAITYILHKSALSGFWRFDDGALLRFATMLAPWEYFFLPEVTRAVSAGVHVTPWNVFFYDVNLWLFGFNPKWFYAHQLVLLWLTSIASFFFLRLWIASTWALFGAILFLAGAPTVHIAHELMTGHYAEGLLFTIIALHAYVVAVRELRWRWALIGALFYLLAVSCKEVYVPLVGILLFLPTGQNLRTRFQFSLPFGLVALFYVFWRYQVLGHLVGGYRPANTGYDPVLILKTFGNIPSFLLGDNTLGKAALLIVAMLIAFNIWNGRLNMKLLVVGATLLLLPLVPLTLFPGIVSADRYLFLIWWGVAVLIAILLSTNTIKYLFIAIGLILVAVTVNNRNEEQQRGMLLASIPYEKLYQFMLNSNSNQFLIPPPINSLSYLNMVFGGIVEAEKIINPLSPQRARIMKDEEELESLDLARTSVLTYDDACKCIKDISAQVPDMILENRKKQSERRLFLHIKFERDMVFWEVGPYSDGTYEIVFKDQGAYPLPDKKGNAAFNISNKLDFYLRYKSPRGWITRGPLLHFEPASFSTLTWQSGVFIPQSDESPFSIFPKKSGGLCFIDALADTISKSIEISASKSSEIKGWALLPNQEIPPEEVAVELLSSSGSRYYANLHRTFRPDVAKHFARPGWQLAGIGISEADFTRIPAGSYSVSILQNNQGTVWRCETGKHLTVRP